MELGAWSLELGAWSLELGAWSLELGAWSLEPGAFKRKRFAHFYKNHRRRRYLSSLSVAIAMRYNSISMFVYRREHKGPRLEARPLLMAAAKAELRIEGHD